VTGTATFLESRLSMAKLSTVFLCCLTGLLTIFSAGLLCMRPRSFLYVRPGSVASVATILAASPDLNRILTDLGGPFCPTSCVRERLQNFLYATSLLHPTGAVDQIKAIPQQEMKANLERDDYGTNRKACWWLPFTGKQWFSSLAIGLSLVTIATLEVAQHLLDQGRGIGLASEVMPLYISYLPILFALGISSIYRSLESMAVLFAPFFTLIAGAAKASRTITQNSNHLLAPQTAYNSIKFRQFSVFTSLLASGISGFLTTIAAGLYSSVPYTRSDTISITRLDYFEFPSSYDYEKERRNTTLAAGLVEFWDMEYPKWTYEDLAFPRINQSFLMETMPDKTGYLTLRIPALRSRLNCTSIPSKHRRLNIEHPDWAGSDLLSINTTLPSQDWCESAPQNSNQSPIWREVLGFSDNTSTSSNYIAEVSGFEWDAEEGLVSMNDPAEYDTFLPTDYGCPALTLSWGMLPNTLYSDNQTQHNIDFATAICYINFEQVDTDVTFQLPDFRLGIKPPQTDESTAILLKNQNGSRRFAFSPGALLTNMEGNTRRDDRISFTFNTLPEAILYGRNKRKLENLVGEANVANIINATNDVYGRYMAQAISQLLRTEISPNATSATSYKGVISYDDGYRLRQSRVSKILLQALLSVMIICAVLTRVLLPLDKILPYNPSSIVGTALLLAGGNMVKPGSVPFPEEGKDGNSQLGEAFKEKTYTLKWWEHPLEDNKRRLRYGIDEDEN
jgi:hypothetical protein